MTCMPSYIRANLLNMAGKKALVHGAMSLPQNHAGRAASVLLRLAALGLPNLDRPWVPYDDLVQRGMHGTPCIPADATMPSSTQPN